MARLDLARELQFMRLSIDLTELQKEHLEDLAIVASLERTRTALFLAGRSPRVTSAHRRRISGPTALRDLGALESAVAQPRASFAGEDHYPDLAAKATALEFSLIAIIPLSAAINALAMRRSKPFSCSTAAIRGHPIPTV